MPTISIYNFDYEDAKKKLKFLEFSDPNVAWLDFVVGNRRGGNLNKNYDIVMGPVADDDVFVTITLYENDELSKLEAIDRFKVKKLFNQVLFCNIEALQFLNYVESISLEVKYG